MDQFRRSVSNFNGSVSKINKGSTLVDPNSETHEPNNKIPEVIFLPDTSLLTVSLLIVHGEHSNTQIVNKYVNKHLELSTCGYLSTV